MGEGNAKDWPRDRVCCTIVVYPGEDIQAAIDALPPQGGCVCLKSGVHTIDHSLNISKSNVILHGEAPGVRIVQTKPVWGMLSIIDVSGSTVVENVEVTHITFDYSVYFDPPDGPTIISMANCRRVRVIHCELLYTNKHEKMLIHGVGLNKANDIAITDCLFDRMESGVFCHDFGSAILVADNIFHGQLQDTPDGITTYNWMAVLLGREADGVVRDNVIENFQYGVWAFGNHAEVTGNRIRTFPLPARDTPPGSQFGISVATKQPSLVQGNDIEVYSQADVGITVRDDCRVTDNVVRSKYPKPSLDGPFGIHVRNANSLIADNHLFGALIGIQAEQATGIQVTGNTIAGDGEAPIAIDLAECHECLVSGNEIRDVVLPMRLTDGDGNRVIGNAATNTRFGAWVVREKGIEFTDDSFDSAAFMGVACVDLLGTAHFSNVRVQNCGSKAPVIALGLVFVQSDPKAALDATIENCDVLETGVAADGSVTPGMAWGIAARYVSHLKISENRVRYPLQTPLQAASTHRALMLFGVPAEVIKAGRRPIERASGAALISGNVFQGPSRDRLVDVRRVVLTDKFDLRFEKLTFSVNRCDHFGRPGPQNITADLYGSHMIVTSNQVKTPAKGHSFGFGNRPRVAATSNYTTGNYVNVATTVPAALLNFNVIV